MTSKPRFTDNERPKVPFYRTAAFVTIVSAFLTNATPVLCGLAVGEGAGRDACVALGAAGREAGKQALGLDDDAEVLSIPLCTNAECDDAVGPEGLAIIERIPAFTVDRGGGEQCVCWERHRLPAVVPDQGRR